MYSHPAWSIRGVSQEWANIDDGANTLVDSELLNELITKMEVLRTNIWSWVLEDGWIVRWCKKLSTAKGFYGDDLRCSGMRGDHLKINNAGWTG